MSLSASLFSEGAGASLVVLVILRGRSLAIVGSKDEEEDAKGPPVCLSDSDCERSVGGSAENRLRSRRNAMEQIWHLPTAAMWGFLLSLA